jgi:uncharacterized protein
MSVVSPILLEILRCPRCMAPLDADEATSELVCQEQEHRYPVVDGIPDMVVD